MDQEKLIEKLVLVCLDTAEAMLENHETVIPFGIRAFKDSEDLKMNCPETEDPEANFHGQIEKIVDELKTFVVNEQIFATALVTELQADDQRAIGLQVETELSSALFIYPFQKEDDKWVIKEPIETDQLLPSVYSRNWSA